MNSQSSMLTFPRRRMLGLMAAVGAAGALGGCGSGGGSGGGAAPDKGASYAAAAKDLQADITYGVWDQTQVKAIKANLAEFNKTYPNIKVNVNVTPYADYWTKLQTQATSNTMPDLLWMNGPNFQLYAGNNKIAPITGEVQAGAIDVANYPKALNDLYTLDGVQYGVPKDFDTVGVWVNQALFAEAGVPLPKDDWTWDEFQSTAANISAKLKSKGIYGAAGGMDGQTTYYDTIFQAGGMVISDDGTKSGYDNPATQEGLEFWRKLIASGGSPSMKQLTDTTADQWFVSGKLAMYWGGSWARTQIADSPVGKNTTVVALPKGKEQATVIHGVSNVVAAASKNIPAAQALQVFLAGKEAQQQQGDMGAVIPAFTGTQQAFAKSMKGVDLQLFLDAVSYAKPYPVSKNSAAWNALETSLLPEAFSGDKPVAEVANDLATKMNALLAKE
jgi:multiple sugar transport system substrate-binding protein